MRYSSCDEAIGCFRVTRLLISCYVRFDSCKQLVMLSRLLEEHGVIGDIVLSIFTFFKQNAIVMFHGKRVFTLPVLLF
jgi:hypothetical protein